MGFLIPRTSSGTKSPNMTYEKYDLLCNFILYVQFPRAEYGKRCLDNSNQKKKKLVGTQFK